MLLMKSSVHSYTLHVWVLLITCPRALKWKNLETVFTPFGWSHKLHPGVHWPFKRVAFYREWCRFSQRGWSKLFSSCQGIFQNRKQPSCCFHFNWNNLTISGAGNDPKGLLIILLPAPMILTSPLILSSFLELKNNQLTCLLLLQRSWTLWTVVSNPSIELGYIAYWKWKAGEGYFLSISKALAFDL